MEWNVMQCNAMQCDAMQCNAMQWNGMEWTVVKMHVIIYIAQSREHNIMTYYNMHHVIALRYTHYMYFGA